MLVCKKSIIALAFCIFLLTSQFASAQDRCMKYNVRVMGMDVGLLTVTEQVRGEDLIIEAITEVRVKIIFTYRVKYIQKSTYHRGELLKSSLLTYKKDKLNSSTYLIRNGDGYNMIKDGDSTFIPRPITYSGSLLYFHEPTDINDLYYEINGMKRPIKRMPSHTYQVTDPENGRESTFVYTDGILQTSSIEHGIATIYTELMTD